MLTYHIVRRKHFKTGKLLYYPQLVTPVADDHMHIIERIEKKCTLASADVKAVVDALEVEIIDSLRQGRSVRLGDLGSFRPTLRCSAGVDLSELAGVGQIKRVHVVFHPSSRPLREGPRRELRAARQKEARRQRATGRFAHGWRYAGSTRAFDGLLGRRLGRDASGHARACASFDGHSRGYACACCAFDHDVDPHGHTRCG